jgi:hypothetical protein
MARPKEPDMDESSPPDRPQIDAVAIHASGKRGQFLLTKVTVCKAALEHALQLVETRAPGGHGGARRANAIGQALAIVDSLLKGDPDDFSPATRTRLSQWLLTSNDLLAAGTAVVEEAETVAAVVTTSPKVG